MSRLDSLLQMVGMGRPMRAAPPMQERGVSGTAVIGGYVVSNEKSSRLYGRERYRLASEMMCNISIVAAGLRYFLNLLAKPKWTVEAAKLPGQDKASAEAEKLAEFVQAVMEDMVTPWPRLVRRAGVYRFHGFGIHEWTAKRRLDGQIGMADVEVRPCHTILRWNVDAGGSVLGAYQTHPLQGNEIELPRSKCIYLVDDTLTDSPEGMGWFRHLVDPADRMATYLKLEGYGFQRDLSGTPIGRAPIQAMNEAVTAGRITQQQADAMLADIKAFVKMKAKSPDTSILLDSQMYTSQSADGPQVTANPQWGLELLTGQQTSLDKINTSIVRIMHDMAYIIGVESLLLGADGKGSLALSKDKSTNLYQNLESTLNDMAAVFSADFVGPLWMLNGLPDELKPKLKPGAVAFQDVEQVCVSLRDMATAGAILQPDDPVIDEVRDLLGVSHQPEISADMLGMMQRATMGGPIDEPPEEDPADDPKNKPAPRKGVGKRRRRPFRKRIGKYDPDQPRDPAGSATGGQWTSGGGGGGGGGEQGSLALAGGGGTNIGFKESLTVEGLVQQYGLAPDKAQALHNKIHFAELHSSQQAQIIFDEDAERQWYEMTPAEVGEKYGLDPERAKEVYSEIESLGERADNYAKIEGKSSYQAASYIYGEVGGPDASEMTASDIADKYGVDTETAEKIEEHLHDMAQSELEENFDDDESSSGFYDDDANSYTTHRSLSEDERTAVKEYQGSGYEDLNKWLSGREHGGSESTLARRRDLLDTAIAKSFTDSDMTVYRGGKGWDAHNWPDQVGKEITFKSYTSTSVDRSEAETFAGNTSYVIDVPSGASALYMNQIIGASNSMANERELLLPRNSRFKVDRVEIKSKTVYLSLITDGDFDG